MISNTKRVVYIIVLRLSSLTRLRLYLVMLEADGQS